MMACGGATIAQLFRMVELMNPGRIPNVLRSSDEEEAQWEPMMVCLFTTLWQKFKFAVLNVCTVPMCTKTLTATGRRHNELVVRWNNILRILASGNAGRLILMDIEHELRAMNQARLTKRLDEMENELFDTRVLRKEETANEPAISTFLPPNLETRLGSVPAGTTYRPQSSSEPGQKTDKIGWGKPQ